MSLCGANEPHNLESCLPCLRVRVKGLEDELRDTALAARRLEKPTDGNLSRPDWDTYFMIIARAVALRMSCDRAQIGALIVSPDKRILSTGYGGAPSGWPSCDEVGHELVEMNGRQSCVRTVHAEENAIVTAARYGVRLDGGTLFTTASTCYDCFKMTAQAGIKRIVYGALYNSARSGSVDILALAKERGIEMVHHAADTWFNGKARYELEQEIAKEITAERGDA